MKTRHVSLRLPAPLVEQADRLAEARYQRRTTVLVEAIRLGLEVMDGARPAPAPAREPEPEKATPEPRRDPVERPWEIADTPMGAVFAEPGEEIVIDRTGPGGGKRIPLRRVPPMDDGPDPLVEPFPDPRIGRGTD